MTNQGHIGEGDEKGSHYGPATNHEENPVTVKHSQMLKTRRKRQKNKKGLAKAARRAKKLGKQNLTTGRSANP
ncbi:MAG: hypothetical protein ACT4PS_05500 [Betaproteobacteria bacterium]